MLFLVAFYLFYYTAAQQNVSEVILAYGYPLEVHETVTEDGFILQLLRIPYGKNATRISEQKKVVLLQHGLGSCSGDWFLNLPYESLGFILADEGYDVWVGNNRGNGYSMRHLKYNSSQREFWYWTWDEMAKYDLPSEINYILNVTSQTQLSYIGISQGTCQMFGALSENKELAKKVNLFIALAPVAYVANQNSLLLRLLADVDVADLLELLGETEFNLPDAIHAFLPGLCDSVPELCEYAISLLLGPSRNINASRVGFYSKYELAPTSVWNMIHWSQGVTTPKFQHMDWGTQENIRRYGQPTPPLYNLANIPAINLALFTGGEDTLADSQDVARLVSEISFKPVSTFNEPTYAHADYVVAFNAWHDDYPTLLSLLKKYNQ